MIQSLHFLLVDWDPS